MAIPRNLANFASGIDASGNVGLGVTPSAWGTGYKAFQIGDSALSNYGTGYAFLSQNALFGTSTNTYINSAAASYYRQFTGTHAWFTAPSGTAGTAISFTQAMTLDGDGNLNIRARTNNATTSFRIKEEGGVDLAEFSANEATGEIRIGGILNNYFPTFYSSNTERFRIASNGAWGLSGANYGTAGQVLTSNGSGSAPSWQNAGGTPGGSNGQVQFNNSGALGGNSNFTFDGTNVGIGLTPYAWDSGIFRALEVAYSTSVYGQLNVNDAGGFATNYFYSGGVSKYKRTGTAMNYYQYNGQHIWFNAPSGTAGSTISWTQAMTLDANGRLGIGTTSPSTRLHVEAPATTGNVDALTIGNNSNNQNDAVSLVWLLGGSRKATIQSIQPGNAATVLTFNTQIDGGTFGERARINNNGYFKASNSGSYNGGASENEFNNSASGSHILGLYNSNASPFGVSIRYTSAAPNASSNYFLLCSDNSANRLFIYSNGNVGNFNNSYGAISDIKLKENITDATPKLASLNQLRVVNYNLKGDSLKQIGLVAQEVEQVFPGLVESSPDRDAEGNDLGTTTKSVKYSVLVPMLLKAVQELTAMNDELRRRVAALEAK